MRDDNGAVRPLCPLVFDDDGRMCGCVEDRCAWWVSNGAQFHGECAAKAGAVQLRRLVGATGQGRREQPRAR